MSEYRYLLLLRVLGAWWCLGSSALQPDMLLEHLADTIPDLTSTVA